MSITLLVNYTWEFFLCEKCPISFTNGQLFRSANLTIYIEALFTQFPKKKTFTFIGAKIIIKSPKYTSEIKE